MSLDEDEDWELDQLLKEVESKYHQPDHATTSRSIFPPNKSESLTTNPIDSMKIGPSGFARRQENLPILKMAEKSDSTAILINLTWNNFASSANEEP